MAKLGRWLRAKWANARNLKKWDYEPFDNGVVISFTTVPSRIHNLKPTLLSLLRQTQRAGCIELNLAKHSRRKDHQTWQIPAWLSELTAVKIQWVEQDLGPGTKSIPTLLRHAQDNAFIVVVDDDMVYSKYLVADLLAADQQAQSKAVFCVNGCLIPRSLVFSQHVQQKKHITGPVRVAVMEGYAGYGLRPSQFDLKHLVDASDAPQDVFLDDDIWISGQLSRQGIPKYRIPIRGKRRTLPHALETAVPVARVTFEDRALHYFADAWKAEEFSD